MEITVDNFFYAPKSTYNFISDNKISFDSEDTARICDKEWLNKFFALNIDKDNKSLVIIDCLISEGIPNREAISVLNQYKDHERMFNYVNSI